MAGLIELLNIYLVVVVGIQQVAVTFHQIYVPVNLRSPRIDRSFINGKLLCRGLQHPHHYPQIYLWALFKLGDFIHLREITLVCLGNFFFEQHIVSFHGLGLRIHWDLNNGYIFY